MAINKLHFSDLKDGCCKKTVASQLQRFWDARNLKKVSEHLGLDLVFLDNKVSENEQLMVLANTNVDFPDVFGDVCGIKTTFTMRIRPFNVLWSASPECYPGNKLLLTMNALPARVFLQRYMDLMMVAAPKLPSMEV
ncbi:uncharacterized protein LOC111214745 isoform X2 [Brassica napus]|uniref:uncharacterized protein LOC111214745 isoform X2 n=1 Tax=Brassica napus TaxID=3708 RepID=UPI002078840C|nr:uncharacterized protein LOC111214745 isoform X2 [Brassica napus]